MVRTDDLSTILDLRAAISGIPIATRRPAGDDGRNQAEGYDGSESCTRRGKMDFLGLRGGIPVYVAAKCGYRVCFGFCGRWG